MSLILPSWSPPTADDFPSFYLSVWRRHSAPWHHDLAERVCTTDTWPNRVNGSEIEAILDVALFWMALDADRPPTQRRAPDRIVWLTERPDTVRARLEALNGALARARAPVLHRVAVRLAARRTPRVRISTIQDVGRLERGMLLLLGEGPVVCSLLP